MGKRCFFRHFDCEHNDLLAFLINLRNLFRSSGPALGAVKPARLITESFRFDADEFTKHVPYKQVELDNGVTLSAPTDKFEEVLHPRKVGDAYAYSTQGAIVDEKLRSSR